MNKTYLAGLGVLLVALVGSNLAWLATSDGESGQSEPFDSCRFVGDMLTLRYSYGTNQQVTVAVDTREEGVTVSLTSRTGEGDTPAIGLSGEASYFISGGPARVMYPDGEPLDCGGS